MLVYPSVPRIPQEIRNFLVVARRQRRGLPGRVGGRKYRKWANTSEFFGRPLQDLKLGIVRVRPVHRAWSIWRLDRSQFERAEIDYRAFLHI